ncbi:4Fe-4S dicluster domain-containing protein [candidate division KSB1 bacterium]|nr:4Fe-4S dicluster domain-containing protein [candidate division KSB1 bacterium]
MQRRDFLKILGIATGSGVITSCGVKKGAEKLIPHVIPPNIEILPGLYTIMKTTCTECPVHCGMQAKIVEKVVNDRRMRFPVKLDGNPDHPVNHGKMCIRGQASLTRLYHPDRLQQPLMRDDAGKLTETTWDDALQKIAAELAKQTPKKHAFLSGRTTGAMSNLIDNFCKQLNIERLPEYEVYSYATLREANRILFGHADLPTYNIDNANYLLTIGADVIETFGNPLQQAAHISEAKEKAHLHWVHCEPHVSLTGLQAHARLNILPGTELYLLLYLLQELIKDNRQYAARLPMEIRGTLPSITSTLVREKTGIDISQIDGVFKGLREAQHPMLIFGGVSAQQETGLACAIVAGLIQWVTGMTDNAIDFAQSANFANVGNLDDLDKLARLLQVKNVGVLFISKTNPVDKHQFAYYMRENLKSADLVVGMTDFLPEQTDDYDIILPLSHPLESWDEIESRRGISSYVQPVLEPLHDTLPEGDILLKLMQLRSSSKTSATDYKSWLDTRWQQQLGKSGADEFAKTAFIAKQTMRISVQLQVRNTGNLLQNLTLPPATNGTVLFVTPSLKAFDGRSDVLPLIKEIPDPLTTITFDSWIAISEAQAKKLKLKDGDIVSLTTGDKAISTLPVKIQPMLTVNVLMVQRHMLDTFALAVNPATGESNGVIDNIKIEKTASSLKLAIMSGSLSQQGRGVIPRPDHRGHAHERVSLYKDHIHPDYQWTMVIDMEKCIGCSACVASCYVENNVGLVGRSEHMKGREMSWIRIEPYYDDGYAHFQPMLCQHCEFAPCESVCPVYAPYHNPEGLNGQVYNRCIGTRYCSNNCPYKVRRFNWQAHPWTTPMDRGLNPQMWARPKGVMEKCTFCIQRIREAKDYAKDEDRKVRDGEVVPACAQTCPTNAITFGNILDENSKVYQLVHSDRVYRVHEHLGTEPSVYYLMKEDGNLGKEHG